MLTPEKLKEIRNKALAAVKDMPDGELKTKAFEIFLHRLIDQEIHGDVGRDRKKESKAVQGDSAKSAKKSRGPKLWLEELIEEGFFDTPKNVRDILSKLAERAHHLRNTDLPPYLTQLTKEKRLRRKKQVPTEGGKKIWHYSNW